jgi:hypothetical protein
MITNDPVSTRAPSARKSSDAAGAAGWVSQFLVVSSPPEGRPYP